MLTDRLNAAIDVSNSTSGSIKAMFGFRQQIASIYIVLQYQFDPAFHIYRLDGRSGHNYSQLIERIAVQTEAACANAMFQRVGESIVSQ
jgi:hypothetical protein